MPAADLALLEDVISRAGALAASYFERSVEVWTKGDDSPVSEADLAVDSFLKEELLAARPDYAWLSEETEDDTARLHAQCVFIADPIDGTWAFINKETLWVVSVAVVEAGRPVAGVVCNPMRGETYTALRGDGARLNGQTISVSAASAMADASFAASKRAMEQAGLLGRGHQRNHKYMKSLAYRLAKVADGTVDAAICTARSHDWDLAASALLVEEAGGRFTDLDGADVILNREHFRHPPLVAAGPTLHGIITQSGHQGREQDTP